MTSVNHILIIVGYSGGMRAFDRLLDLVAPYDCLNCGRESRLVCESCWPLLAPEGQNPVAAPVWSLGSYTGLSKALVRAMKVDCQRQACYLIARAMHERAPPLPKLAVITSVPTAGARIRERGFDHAGLIAREFARLRGVSYLSLLVRRGRAKQAGTTKAIRLEQIKGVYSVVANRLPSSAAQIVLIDDIVTSGSTLKEVSAALNKSGAQVAGCVVFASATKKHLLAS